MSTPAMKPGAALIAEERQRQIEAEGWSPEHDDEHVNGELVYAAICYTVNCLKDRHGRLQENIPTNPTEVDGFFGIQTVVDWVKPAWPWSDKDDRRIDHDRIRSLTIAGALIAAEIDRLQRSGKER